MHTTSGKNLVWLIRSPAHTVSLAAPLKRMLDGNRLMVFPTWEAALRQTAKHPLPQLIVLEGTPDVNQITKIRSQVPGAPLFVVTGYPALKATADRVVLTTPPQPASKLVDAYRLTARERQILQLLVQGLIKKQIAEHLSLSFHTVNNHERKLYQKLKVHTRSAAVAKALIERLC